MAGGPGEAGETTTGRGRQAHWSRERCLKPPRRCDTKANANQLQGDAMAIDPSGGHPAMDYAEHVRTYSGFIRATMVMIAIIVVTLLFMLFFLVP
jgi:hypothetical protein